MKRTGGGADWLAAALRKTLLALVLLALAGTDARAQATPAGSGARVYAVPASGAAARYRVPQVQLPAAGAAAARRINAALIQQLLTDNLEDARPAATVAQAVQRVRAEYEGNGQSGVYATSYRVLLNQGGLLSLALTVEYSAAYPSTEIRHATFDLRTGRLLALADLLADTLALRQRWHQRLNQRVATRLREVAREYPGDSGAAQVVRDYTQWSDSAHQVLPRSWPPLGEFALTPQGLVLFSRFEFPHVVLALAPANDYLFAWAQVRPWLKPGGLGQALGR